MDESILKALMRLFAIIANVNKDGISSSARRIVVSYLNHQVSQSQVSRYLQLFDDHLESHSKKIRKPESRRERKRRALNSVKVLLICQQVNESLQQKDKVIVLLRLLEFVKAQGRITEKEEDFIATVADTFNISDTEYKNIRHFVLDNLGQLADKTKLLIVDSHATPPPGFEFKHIYNENLDGRIGILHIRSTNTFVFRYTGSDALQLNGHNTQPDRAYVFDHGSFIKSPRISPVYHSDVSGRFFESETATKVVLTAENIEFRFKNSENGIHSFNFSEESGQLVGIMGGSGVGKSTLLNVLNGNLAPRSGKVTINGYDIYTEKEHLKGVIGFVPQDDLLIEELSVFQNLYYNAKLCFRDFSETRILRKVARILSDLDLHEIKHLTVGNPLNKFISGGQRKRLNIALELMREPSVLFVDEPTSGLSSMDSEMVMLLLKKQTLKGKLVIVNIHQPSSDIFKLFDKLLVMDKGGRTVYYGNPLDSLTYFKKAAHHVDAEQSECPTCGNVNPEQILHILEEKVVNEHGKFTRNRKISPQDWYKAYREKIDSKIQPKPTPEKLPKNYFKVPGKFRQFKIFGIRNVLSKLSNRQYLLINFLEAPILAAIIGYFTKYIAGTHENPNLYIFSQNDNIPAYLFMAVIVALFIGLTVSAEEIIRDRKILKREQFLNLSRFSYINSKVIILFAISAIQVISFILIGNLILGIKGMTLSYFLILFSTACFANMVGLNISSALNSVVSIYILIPLILVPQLLFSGVIVNFDKLHKSITSQVYVPVIGDLMASRWAYEALAVEQFKNNEFQKHFFDTERQMSQSSFIYSFLLPELQTKLSENEDLMAQNKKPQQVKRNFQILRNSVENLNQRTKNMRFEKTQQLTAEKFSPAIAKELRDHWALLKQYYTEKYKKYSKQKDRQYLKLVEKLGGKDEVFELKRAHHNESLAEMVLSKNELQKIHETETRLVQKKDPIYKYPLFANGRAHFYSPVKKIGNYYIETFWFNVAAIWLFSIVLYFMLLDDTIRKTIEFFERLKFRKKI